MYAGVGSRCEQNAKPNVARNNVNFRELTKSKTVSIDFP